MNVANTTPGTAEAGGKKSLEERAVSELEKYAVISAYLWVLFALFSLYKREVLQERAISVWQQSFVIVNALIFGKVILIAQALEFGKSLERRALIWIVLGKSLIFAILAFHIVEEAIRAWFKSQPVSASLRRSWRHAIRSFDLRCYLFCRVDSILRVPGGCSHPRWRCPLELVLPRWREAVSAD
jgi:hypothetical protein